MDSLAAGINTGQHEGGGKSLEIRRFGYNLDHGGVNGGLKVLVDDIQQNQGTQGHGQGYLGTLKSPTPELIDDVDILNGPFNAEYGDWSCTSIDAACRAVGCGLQITFCQWSVKLSNDSSDDKVVVVCAAGFNLSKQFIRSK
jgi:hypothetical protein